ncbi:4Fe-4S dicluster domain-containing protein [Aureicoccus marinus]|uniref:Fe-S oxidoreductase n=1 Tax=Aureicoccus marinus TaxID=754435 RepID=A0A2S7T5Q8_9FLAO|nr:4Fe-4S dicluster domain-containing protein [Aureicoccus marinus]PQJ15259.1 Fe-S oxidoreductase [Aureicoccus marinus]
MEYLPNVIFVLVLAGAIGLFAKNVGKLRRNIFLGQKVDRSDQKSERWKMMGLVALGQTKMVVRPIAGFLHIIVYLGFIIINIEVLEIVLDGILGTHRLFAFLGGVYDFLIGSFEILAFLVVVSVVVFWLRRNSLKLARFVKPEMKGWPKNDANLILYIEVVLMGLFLTMNAADYQLQQMGSEHYVEAGSFPISSFIAQGLAGWSESSLILLERACWWLHIIGILSFLNYLYYSKHLHIILAFPNTWYAKLQPAGEINNLESVTQEVKMMMDPSADPFAAPAEDSGADVDDPGTFGAKDVQDLNWVQLMNAYTCTECGRCTSECPANQTGKLLSPRKIMMDTRDRLEEVGKVLDANKGEWKDDGKNLLDDYITREELWACTTCNACTQACPIGIDPLSIIVDMRRYLVMEESAAPNDLNVMMGNVENNGAPWPFNQMDRLNWANES